METDSETKRTGSCINAISTHSYSFILLCPRLTLVSPVSIGPNTSGSKFVFIHGLSSYPDRLLVFRQFGYEVIPECHAIRE